MATDKARAADERQPDLPVNRRYRMPLPPHPIAAEQARVLVRLALSDWNMTGVIDNALVIAAELAANAVKIGEVFRITLSCHNGTVLIEVWDSSEASPERQRQSMDRVDGRGLLLVEGCSKDWGWRLEETGGKTIWALVDDLDAEPDPVTIGRRRPYGCDRPALQTPGPECAVVIAETPEPRSHGEAQHSGPGPLR